MSQFKSLDPARVKYIVVHCAATRPTSDIGASDIDQWHRAHGWLAIGYHVVIRRNGTVETGRPLDAVGSHVRNFNSVSVGVCLVGGVDAALKPENNFTPAQFSGLRVVLTDLTARFPAATIVGHRDLDPGKACPSFDVSEYLARNPIS